jgi:hypothetical protein
MTWYAGQTRALYATNGVSIIPSNSTQFSISRSERSLFVKRMRSLKRAAEAKLGPVEMNHPLYSLPDTESSFLLSAYPIANASLLYTTPLGAA